MHIWFPRAAKAAAMESSCLSAEVKGKNFYLSRREYKAGN